jgi:glutamate-5-semialdehyde dehydrogenase
VSNLQVEIRALCRQARSAAPELGRASTETKNRVLERIAAELSGPAKRVVLDANESDLHAFSADRERATPALIDRLTLSSARIDDLARAVRDIARLPDPIGPSGERRTRPNGLVLERHRVPLGVIAIIYEARPNVTADAAALCIKSGNAVVLRGGKEAFATNTAIAAVVGRALESEGLPRACATFVPTTDRDAALELLRQSDSIDVVIPRGGQGLIDFVTEHARVPVLKHAKGVCHVFVDRDADLEMAERIVVNAKTQRPGVCNALETLLVDEACAASFLPRVARALRAEKVELRGDDATRAIVAEAVPATEDDWSAEYLDLVLAIRVVGGLDGALAHIARYGTNHTEAIVTRSEERAARFVREVDASLVAVNASTRFNDGGQLGLGAEMGISTTKLHAYGPMGLEELCALKWVAYGTGQIREK